MSMPSKTSKANNSAVLPNNRLRHFVIRSCSLLPSTRKSPMFTRFTLATSICLLTSACTAEWILPKGYVVECENDTDCPETAQCTLSGDGNTQVCITDGETFCGNGVQEVGETCDHGLLNSNGYHLIQTCQTLCGGYGSYCGDGIIDASEKCDSTDPSSGCNSECQRSEDVVCGDCSACRFPTK